MGVLLNRLPLNGGPMWGISFYTNSHNPRAVKWYRLSRLIYADGSWWELYWGNQVDGSNNLKEFRKACLAVPGLNVLAGVFTQDAPGSRMKWSHSKW